MEPFVPAVSVIIPCYRADDFVGAQLVALSMQIDAPAFEVLLIDNGMNDRLGETAAQFPHLMVRILDASHEAGTGYARNVGIAHARGDFLLFCDADDVVARTWVRDGARQLQQWPAFSGGAIPFAPEIFTQDIANIWVRLEEKIEPIPAQLPSFGIGSYPILLGCSFGMTRELAMELGGFDRAFGAQAEDNDLAFRLREALGFVPAARHIAVAYRTRTTSEATFARGYEAGLKHAMMCARHNSWSVSPSYQGRWVLRGVKETVVAVVRGDLALDPLGRQLGVLIGRARFTSQSAPKKRLGLTSQGDWGNALSAYPQILDRVVLVAAAA